MDNKLADGRDFLGDFVLSRDFTYLHHDGSTARLDYQLITSSESVLSFKTIDFNRIATNHRAIVMDINLFRFVGGWKTRMRPFCYPIPINITVSTAEKEAEFASAEQNWLSSVENKLYVALVENKSITDGLVLQEQESFLKGLSKLCSKTASKIWNAEKGTYMHKKSKVRGILEGKLTWLRRAHKGAKELQYMKAPERRSRRGKSLLKRISTSKWFPELTITNWVNSEEHKKRRWRKKIIRKCITLNKELKEVCKQEREEQRVRSANFVSTEGARNTGKFRRWKLREVADPDGEAVKDKFGDILVSDKEIRHRYGEYYASLFSGEEARVTPPNERDRDIWMDPTIIAENKTKLQQATGGKSIASESPSLEEYMKVVNDGSASSSGGPDRIQYGLLKKLSLGTHQAIVGLVGVWWRTKSLPEILRLVEFCSLHKRGDRLDLFNKRGIGLVSKLVLIFETILLNRVSEALDKAGTRSRAQGGAKKGVHTIDVVATTVNVMHHALRNEKILHMVEFDLLKFFDRIPHRAFWDAFFFFGFDEETIIIASLFWRNFVGKARTRFGYSQVFPILIGNIQGLAGSPSRSGYVLDMILITIERKLHGYRFTTDRYHGDREHELDDNAILIYATAWVDDVTLIDEDFDRIKQAVLLFSTFINYYTMRFVPEKCKHYVVNDTNSDSKILTFSDFNGISHTIQKADVKEAFRVLGVFLNLNAEWHAHADHLVGKLGSFITKAGKHWSPPWLTAKIVNSNAVPSISYGLTVVDLDRKELTKLQNTVTRAVANDGSHSRFITNEAYCAPHTSGGYNVMSISAIYKASKIAGLYHLLNSTYYQSRITTRMTLLDLQRNYKYPLSPVNSMPAQIKSLRYDRYPDYIIAAINIAAELKVEIIPREGWDLRRITVATFFMSFVSNSSNEAIVELLRRLGYRYMAEVCSWFDCADTWEGFKLPMVVKLAIMKGLNSAIVMPQTPPLFENGNLANVSHTRRKIIQENIKEGIVNLLSSDWVLSFVPYTYKNTRVWMEARFQLTGQVSSITGKVYTDGSRRGGVASFAVVDSNDDLIVKSNTVGRASSQRAELFGTVVATYLRPYAEKVSDPKFILHSINKTISNGMLEHEWKKVDNRSLIKCVARLNALGDGKYTWVKGHQKVNITEDGKHNIEADTHAKTLIEDPKPPLVGEAWECVDDYFFVRNKSLFEGDIRKTVYEDALKLEMEKLCTKNSRFSHSGWWMEAPTNEDMSRYGAFRFKLFTRSLPTHHRMSKRFPGLYKELRCPGCGTETETDEHLFIECNTYKGLKWEIWEKVSCVLMEVTEVDYGTIAKEAPNWICLTTTAENSALNLWFLAGIPDGVREWLCLFLDKKERVAIWKKVHNIVISAVHDIWNVRCDRNRIRGWTLEDLQLDFLEEAIHNENNYLLVDTYDAPLQNDHEMVCSVDYT